MNVFFNGRKIINTFLAPSRYVQVNQENDSSFQLGAQNKFSAAKLLKNNLGIVDR